MGARVENLDDLTFDFYAIGDVNHVTEHISDLFRNRRFAVAGRSVEQNGAAGIDRGTDLLHEIFRDHHLCESVVNRRAVHAFVGDRLAPDTIAVDVQRHGRGPDVLVECHRVLGPLLALVGQRVTEF